MDGVKCCSTLCHRALLVFDRVFCSVSLYALKLPGGRVTITLALRLRFFGNIGTPDVCALCALGSLQVWQSPTA